MKCEAVYLLELADGTQAGRTIAEWIAFYRLNSCSSAWLYGEGSRVVVPGGGRHLA